MTLTEMRERVEAFLSLGKHWRPEMAQWEALSDKDGRGGFRLRIYTDRHVYSIVMRPAQYEAWSDGSHVTEVRSSYLGCVVSNRAPWPGETHTRGGDLADGEFADETLRKIWADILSRELHPVIVQPTPKAVG